MAGLESAAQGAQYDAAAVKEEITNSSRGHEEHEVYKPEISNPPRTSGASWLKSIDSSSSNSARLPMLGDSPSVNSPEGTPQCIQQISVGQPRTSN